MDNGYYKSIVNSKIYKKWNNNMCNHYFCKNDNVQISGHKVKILLKYIVD